VKNRPSNNLLNDHGKKLEHINPMVETKKIINEFCITFSTINGSGSATANTTLMRALFKMGIPVSGKNIFPSNIQGQPTWFSLRLSAKGYYGRVEKDDIMVAMNPGTVERDLKLIKPGGVLLIPDDFRLPDVPADLHVYAMPVKKLMKEMEVNPKLREYIANMVYVGILAALLDIPIDDIEAALVFQFKGKRSAIDPNLKAVKYAWEWANANLTKTDAYFVEPMDGNQNCIMTDGNQAGALGAIYGGVQYLGWYPITPATSLAESLMEYLPSLRQEPGTGKDTCVVVQAEDELAAIGMAVGAGWSGLRSMTSTSGPGLSLMTETLGLAYYAEVPVVIWDVQRVGPSTGMPTRTAQGDLTMVNFISHGDTQMIQLIPGSVNECFEFGWKAFDIAERLQTPVLIMSDLDFGMNQWTTKAFQYPDAAMDRGKVLWENELDSKIAELDGKWGRYLDVDGDGIPYRTLPGNRNHKSAYFARGTSHDEYATYTESPEVWERVFNRIARKIELGKKYLPQAVIETEKGASFGIIACGSSDPAVEEARDFLRSMGLQSDYLRVRSIPFGDEVKTFLESHNLVYVVDNNRDGQLAQLLQVSFPSCACIVVKIAHMNGLPLSAEWIQSQIKAAVEK
jgi:2-oxoglutarate ferredoxin oxidoreductase subunit alpha